MSGCLGLPFCRINIEFYLFVQWQCCQVFSKSSSMKWNLSFPKTFIEYNVGKMEGYDVFTMFLLREKK